MGTVRRVHRGRSERKRNIPADLRADSLAVVPPLLALGRVLTITLLFHNAHLPSGRPVGSRVRNPWLNVSPGQGNVSLTPCVHPAVNGQLKARRSKGSEESNSEASLNAVCQKHEDLTSRVNVALPVRGAFAAGMLQRHIC
ncbi:hypothetical protein PoB_002692900 [Plakobranchus ocellatus]|uniref:Uncharacterized protein n=1 Tax=Plakobranchus ocellatus TaxID=259542 RepID=A0AAV3ZYM7_9GAST|nr:hypothetical protein PoB_002692900 [Plakobranchus ocellatus]